MDRAILKKLDTGLRNLKVIYDRCDDFKILGLFKNVQMQGAQ